MRQSKKLFTGIASVIFIYNMAFGAINQPTQPNWHSTSWTNRIHGDALDVHLGVYSGNIPLWFEVELGGITLATLTTADQSQRMLDHGEHYFEDFGDIDVSSLNQGTHYIVIKACNDIGCVQGQSRQIYKLDGDAFSETTADTQNEQALAEITKPADPLAVDIEATNKQPGQPFTDYLAANQGTDFVVSWQMWWGYLGDKALLYIGSVMVGEVKLEYSEGEGQQKGSFDVNLKALVGKGLKTGTHNISIRLCYEDLCAVSPTRTLILRLPDADAAKKQGVIGSPVDSLQTEKEIENEKASLEQLEKLNKLAEEEAQKAEEEAQKAQKAQEAQEELDQELEELGAVIKEYPAVPAIDFIPETTSEDFSFKIIKSWGNAGNVWKLKHTNSLDGEEQTYNIGYAEVNEFEPLSTQEVSIYVKLNENGDLQNRSMRRVSSYTLNIDVSEAATHTFTPILCNNNGCTESDLSSSTILTPNDAEEITEDESRNNNVINSGAYVGLKMDKSTWSESEQLYAKTLSELNEGLYVASADYIAPEAKACPSIDGNGKIAGKEAIVYYNSQSIYNEHYVRSINGCNVTGIVYGFANPGPNGRLYIGDGWSAVQTKVGSRTDVSDSSKYQDDPTLGYFGVLGQVVQFKKEYTHVKSYLGIGGAQFSSYISRLIQYEDIRSKFVEDVVTLVRTFQFDGVHLDWHGEMKTVDRDNLTTLVEDINIALSNASIDIQEGFLFDSNVLAQGVAYVPAHGAFTLSVGLPSNVNNAQYYDLASIDKVVDFAIYAGYFALSSSNTMHQAALYSSNANVDDSVGQYLTVDGALEVYLNGEIATVNPSGFNESGMNAAKVILGLPYIANGWSTANSNIFQDSTTSASITRLKQQSTKNLKIQIAENRDSWTLSFDNTAKAMYAYNNANNALWSLEDERSICEKSKYVLAQNLAGIAGVYSGLDDGTFMSTTAGSLTPLMQDCSVEFADTNYDIVN